MQYRLSTQLFNPYLEKIKREGDDMIVFYEDGRIITFKDFYSL